MNILFLTLLDFDSFAEKSIYTDLLREFTKLGIDTAAGLHYCNQDEEFYYSLLLQYAGDMEKKLSLLEQYRTEKNYPDYAIHIHSIKSTSKMIGEILTSRVANSRIKDKARVLKEMLMEKE